MSAVEKSIEKAGAQLNQIVMAAKVRTSLCLFEPVVDWREKRMNLAVIDTVAVAREQENAVWYRELTL